MKRVFSTYRYVNQSLSSALLTKIAQAGFTDIEIFCSSFHFDYRAPQTSKDLLNWLEEHRLGLHSLHSPTERDLAPGRESGAPISISDPERVRRLDAVDEVKRALELAERVPFRFLVQHLGHGRQASDPRRRDAAFNSLEHLVIFAKQRGVAIALENTPGELGSPESLQQFIAETHLKDLRLCFDVGHARIESGVEKSFEIMRERVVTVHIHDNHGEKDEHLLPYEGSIDWAAAVAAIATAPEPLPFVLEFKEQSATAPTPEQGKAALDRLGKELEGKRSGAAR